MIDKQVVKDFFGAIFMFGSFYVITVLGFCL